MKTSIVRGASAAFMLACVVGPRVMLAPPGEGGGGGDDRDLGQLAKDLKTATDEVKKFAEKATAEMKNLGDVTGETKQAADKALTEMNGIALRLDEVEQKLARRGNPSETAGPRSPGEIAIGSDEYKSAAKDFGDTWRGSMRIEVKAITSASASGASVSTALVPADRQAGIIRIPERQLTVRDLLAPGRTNSGAIEFAREDVFTNAAAAVAENPSAVKPESNLTFVLQNTPVRTIAHWVPASKQILADAPQLQSIIDGRLRYGLKFKEDEQLLLGDGTGVNLLGLMPQATAYSAPAGITVTSPTKIDRLRLAMLQATLALFPATGHVLNPIDWTDIELTKDAGGNYIFSNPAGLVGPTLWGLPVAQSLAMPAGNFLTGALAYAAQIFDREDAEVLISTEDRDNFVKNMVTILCEERLALAVYRPKALIKGTFA